MKAYCYKLSETVICFKKNVVERKVWQERPYISWRMMLQAEEESGAVGKSDMGIGT
jgi:hypothetical protein